MKTIGLSLLVLGVLGIAANAEPVKLGKAQMDKVVAGAITTQNPGGQTGGCSNNPNCVSVNPAGRQPPGQNR